MAFERDFGHLPCSSTTERSKSSKLLLQRSCSSCIDVKESAVTSFGSEASAATLLEQLPDSDVELFQENAHTALKRFTLFGLLPKELRMIIWRAAFLRNRTVQIELSPAFAILHSHISPPVVLHINRESRIEALKFYIPLLEPCARRPIYFYPAFDTIYFHRKVGNDVLGFMQSHAYLTTHSLSGMSRIQSLKIPKMSYGGQLHGWIKFGLQRRSLYGHGNYVEPDRGGLRFFHGLEELVLVGETKIFGCVNYLGILNCTSTLLTVPPEDIIFTLDTEERIEEYVQAFRRFFEWEREKHPDCKIPHIVVRQEKNWRADKWYVGRLSEDLH